MTCLARQQVDPTEEPGSEEMCERNVVRGAGSRFGTSLVLICVPYIFALSVPYMFALCVVRGAGSRFGTSLVLCSTHTAYT